MNLLLIFIKIIKIFLISIFKLEKILKIILNTKFIEYCKLEFIMNSEHYYHNPINYQTRR